MNGNVIESFCYTWYSSYTIGERGPDQTRTRMFSAIIGVFITLPDIQYRETLWDRSFAINLGMALRTRFYAIQGRLCLICALTDVYFTFILARSIQLECIIINFWYSNSIAFGY